MMARMEWERIERVCSERVWRCHFQNGNILKSLPKRLFENNSLIKKQEKFLGAAFFQKGGVF